jgi:hypothetical protein
MNIPDSPSPQELQEVEPDVELLIELAVLPPYTLISESKLAQMAGCHVTSVKRAIQRGELPPSAPRFGANVWTVEAILAHISARLEAERTAAVQTTRRVQHLRPGQGGCHYWCVVHRYLAADPLQALGRLATTPQTHRRAMTVAEIQRVLAVAPAH